MELVNNWWLPNGDKYYSKFAKEGKCELFNDYYGSLKLAMEYVDDHTVAIDGGGHVGTWAKELAKKFLQVYSYECWQPNYECFEKNVTSDNVTLIKAALGERCGTTSYVQGSTSGAGYSAGKGGDIPTRVIDDLELLTCGLIKLDIEGNELYAMKGAEETIKRCKPVLLFEDKGCETRHFGIPKGAIHEYLTSLGYEKKDYLNRDSIYVHTSSSL